MSKYSNTAKICLSDTHSTLTVYFFSLCISELICVDQIYTCYKSAKYVMDFSRCL